MQHARAGLEKITAQIVRDAAPEEAPLLAWPLICGSRVAAKAVARGFSSGVLRIEVPDANWQAQLSSFAPQYLAALNQVLTGAPIERLVFIVRQPWR